MTSLLETVLFELPDGTDQSDVVVDRPFVVRTLSSLAEDEDQEVRNAAIFALSQRPDDEGLPALMELARTGAHAETRKTAMFWLAQSGDERVVAFFEEILLRRNR